MTNALRVVLLSCAFALSSQGSLSAAGEPAMPSTDSALAAPVRDPRWAVAIEKPGLPNFYKVSDDLYRGAQPAAEGFKALKDMGVKTVLNLRSFHSDKDLLAGTGLAYENIDVKAWRAEDEDLAAFLKVVTDKTRTPVFVHCQHGADRTGMMVAVYRIAVQGWSKDDAIKEMTEGGFGWHPVWQNLADHIRELDVDALKKAAGIAPAAKPPK